MIFKLPYGRKSDSFWLCSMVLLQNFVLKNIFVLTKFKICQHKFDPKSDSLWWDSEVFLHTFLLIVWFVSTKLMILLHSLGPEFDAYWWRTELSLNFFVLKAYFFGKFHIIQLSLDLKCDSHDGFLRLYNLLLCWKSNLFRPILWFWNFLMAESLIHFDCVQWFYCIFLYSK